MSTQESLLSNLEGVPVQTFEGEVYYELAGLVREISKARSTEQFMAIYRRLREASLDSCTHYFHLAAPGGRPGPVPYVNKDGVSIIWNTLHPDDTAVDLSTTKLRGDSR